MIEMLRQCADKFWARIAKHGDDECWPWQKAHDRSGYGKFQFRYLGKKKCVKAHRAAYMLANDCDISSTQFVCHRCDNPKCVNPAHLILADNDFNMADCAFKGRFAKGSKLPQAKLTESQVTKIRRRVAAGEIKSSLAREFGVAKSTITYAVGKGWKHGWKHV